MRPKRAGVILPGMRVEFLNGDADPAIGIVNGAPWVYFDGIDAVARVPVHVPATGNNIDVAGHNIVRVGESPVLARIRDYSVRA